MSIFKLVEGAGSWCWCWAGEVVGKDLEQNRAEDSWPIHQRDSGEQWGGGTRLGGGGSIRQATAAPDAILVSIF